MIGYDMIFDETIREYMRQYDIHEHAKELYERASKLCDEVNKCEPSLSSFFVTLFESMLVGLVEHIKQCNVDTIEDNNGRSIYRLFSNNDHAFKLVMAGCQLAGAAALLRTCQAIDEAIRVLAETLGAEMEKQRQEFIDENNKLRATIDMLLNER